MVGLPPGMMTIVSGCDLDAVAAGQVLRHRLAQRQDALGRRVAVVAVAQRLDGGFDDVAGRLEVGLADAEVDDRLALALELGGARQHLEGRLGSQALQVVARAAAWHFPRSCGPATRWPGPLVLDWHLRLAPPIADLSAPQEPRSVPSQSRPEGIEKWTLGRGRTPCCRYGSVLQCPPLRQGEISCGDILGALAGLAALVSTPAFAQQGAPPHSGLHSFPRPSARPDHRAGAAEMHAALSAPAEAADAGHAPAAAPQPRAGRDSSARRSRAPTCRASTSSSIPRPCSGS